MHGRYFHSSQNAIYSRKADFYYITVIFLGKLNTMNNLKFNLDLISKEAKTETFWDLVEIFRIGNRNDLADFLLGLIPEHEKYCSFEPALLN